MQREALPRKVQLELLESAEGYGRLTPYQQQLIHFLFLAQDQAEQFVQGKIRGPKGQTRQDYRGKSMQHMLNWCCFDAVNAVEKEMPITVQYQKPENDFFEGALRPVRNFSELENWLAKEQAPSVVHLCGPLCEEGDDDGLKQPCHSLIHLGKNKTGTSVTWEKQGPRGLPYNVRPLHDIYNELEAEAHLRPRWWRARPLRTKTKSA